MIDILFYNLPLHYLKYAEFQCYPDPQVITYPDVKASIRAGRIVVSIDKNVILLDNDEENSCELIQYDSHM